MDNLNGKQQERFVQRILDKQCIDLSAISFALNIPFSAVEKTLREESGFLNKVEEAFRALVFKIYQRLYEAANQGSDSSFRAGDQKTAEFIINLVNSGKILAPYRMSGTPKESRNKLLAKLAKPRPGNQAAVPQPEPGTKEKVVAKLEKPEPKRQSTVIL